MMNDFAGMPLQRLALVARRTACGSFFARRARNDPPIEQSTMLPQAKKPERKQTIHYEFVKM
jgi:hypothetical protein